MRYKKGVDTYKNGGFGFLTDQGRGVNGLINY